MNIFKRLSALVFLSLVLIVAHAGETEGPTGDIPNKGLAVSDNSSTKAYDPNLIAKSNGAPAIYNELKHNDTVRIIMRYKMMSVLPKLNAQNSDLN